MLNLVDKVSDEWWLLVVPVGLLVVPLTGVVALFKLLAVRATNS